MAAGVVEYAKTDPVRMVAKRREACNIEEANIVARGERRMGNCRSNEQNEHGG